MRGAFMDQGGLFSYIAPEARVPANHPLRKIRELVRDVLGELNRSLGKLYASEGRPSIPPEQLLSALLLQVFYGIRSERQLMEQLDYNLLYRWFVGLSPEGRQRRRRWRGQFPRTAAQERHACEHQRSREPSLSQGRRAGGEALLYGPRYHGEPAWAGGGRQGHARQRDRRAPRFGDNAQGQSQGGRPPHHGGRRQGL